MNELITELRNVARQADEIADTTTDQAMRMFHAGRAVGYRQAAAALAAVVSARGAA